MENVVTSKNLLQNPKVGDKCYFCFKLGIIHDMDGDEITAFKRDEGGITAGTLNGSCFEANEEVKSIADSFHELYSKLNITDSNMNGLCFPAIYSHMIRLFERACKEDTDAALRTAENFIKIILDKLTEIREIRVDDVRIFM